MKRFLSFLFVSAMLCMTAMAQTTVSGTVTDESGDGLEGVAVLIKGTTTGAFTNSDGKYTLRVPDGSEMLVFTMVGRATLERSIEGSTLDVAMTTEDVTMDEVVVTALGISRDKKALGYAVQEIGGEDVSNVKDVNFINNLSGRVAGVDINRSSTLGGSANVVVRGYKSLLGNNQAIFVVDGIIMGNNISGRATSQAVTGSNQATGRGGYDFGNAAADINPDDIESISVLKGAAATALYGSIAANGAVIIKTKRGRRKKGLGVSVSTGYVAGQVDRTTLPVYQKQYGPGYSTLRGWYAEGGLDLYDFGDGPAYSVPVYDDAAMGHPYDESLNVYDWRSYYRELDSYGQAFPFVGTDDDANNFFETSGQFNANVAIDGATDKGAFRLSYTTYSQQGIIPNSLIQRNTLNFAADYELTEKLSVSSNINYVVTDGRGRYGTGYDNRNPNQAFRQWYMTNVSMTDQREAYEQTGLNISWNPYGGLDPARLTVPHYFDNFYFNAYENVPTDNRNRIFGNVSLNYELTKDLKFLARFTTDRYNELQETRIAVGSVDVSEYTRRNVNYEQDNTDLILTYDKFFGASEDLSVSALVGANFRRVRNSSIYAETNGGLVVPGVYSLSNSVNGIEAPTEYAATIGTDGYYARLTLGYQNMLYVDLTGRQDYSSTLPEGSNGYFYPSVSGSFVFSELMNTQGNFNFGKFRLNYAEVGNGTIPYQIQQTYFLGTSFGVPLASGLGRRLNPNLAPEETRAYEAGLELSFFQNRLALDVSVYQSNTINQIIPLDVTAATGYIESVINTGDVQNRGIEAILTATPVRTSDFSWDISVNFARNVNKVVDIYVDPTGDTVTNIQLATMQGGISINAELNEPYGAIKGTNFVYDEDGNATVVEYSRFGGYFFQKTAAPEVIGNIMPDFIGGISNTFSYKNLSLSFLIDVQQGGNFFSLDTWYGSGTGQYDFTAGTNAQGGQVRDLPAEGGGLYLSDIQAAFPHLDGLQVVGDDGAEFTGPFFASDYASAVGWVTAPNAVHIYDASFVKLRELNLSYSLPQSVLASTPLTALSIALIGRNLWIISKNSPYSDPEAGLSAGNVQGYQSGAYPMVKEYGVNLQVKF